MFGFLASKHVVEIGRSALFPDHDNDLPLGRSAVLRHDDLTPQFGFVGTKYSSTRIVLLGINPGNGRKNAQTPADKRMMPALRRFAQNPTEFNYAEATRAYSNECQTWPVWKRHCAEVIGAGKLSLEQIAYVNCLPWRTESESRFSDDVAERAATLYLRPLIEEIEPRMIVAMGKRVPSILAMTRLNLPRIIVWNRSQAPTEAVKRERIASAQEIFAFTNLEMAVHPEGAHSNSTLPTFFQRAHGENALTIQAREILKTLTSTGVDMKVTETLELLKALESLGFTDDDFWRLHHKREPTASRMQPQREKISSFRQYCEEVANKTNTFMIGSQNRNVHDRLAFVLREYRAGAFAPGQSDVFIALAERSFVEIPPRLQ